MSEQEREYKSFEATVEFGRAATSSVILINGGAATALMAFFGANEPTAPALIALAFLAFGALCGAVCHGFAYASQGFATTDERNFKALRYCSVGSFIFAILCFVLGVVAAIAHFLSVSQMLCNRSMF